MQSNHTAISAHFNTILTPTTLYHLTAVADGTHIRGFINGKPEANTYPYDGTLNHDSTADLLIGKLVTEWHKGILDQLIIYNRALDTTEIQRHSERRYPV